MRGAFSYQDVSQTAMALCAYAPGLLFVGVSRILVPTFYALQDTRTPVWVSFWTLVVNAVLGVLLMGPLRHVGLALALSLSSVCNCLLLGWLLRRKIGPVGFISIGGSLLRALPATLLMAAGAWLILKSVDWQVGGWSFTKLFALGSAVGVGMAIYCGVCLLCGVTEIRDGLRLVSRRLGFADKG